MRLNSFPFFSVVFAHVTAAPIGDVNGKENDGSRKTTRNRRKKQKTAGGLHAKRLSARFITLFHLFL